MIVSAKWDFSLCIWIIMIYLLIPITKGLSYHWIIVERKSQSCNGHSPQAVKASAICRQVALGYATSPNNWIMYQDDADNVPVLHYHQHQIPSIQRSSDAQIHIFSMKNLSNDQEPDVYSSKLHLQLANKSRRILQEQYVDIEKRLRGTYRDCCCCLHPAELQNITRAAERDTYL